MVTKDDILNACKSLNSVYPNWRWGQTVFNYIDYTYGVARQVQFEDKFDCFYHDDNVDKFIELSLKRINNES